MAYKKNQQLENVIRHGRYVIGSLFLLLASLVIADIISLILINFGYSGVILAPIIIVALINVLLLTMKYKNKLLFLFFVYGFFDLAFALLILCVTKFHIPLIAALASMSSLLYLVSLIVILFTVYVFKMLFNTVLFDIIGRFESIIVIASVLLAYYLPTYSAILVTNISGLEETLLVSTTISLIGLPIFSNLRKTSNKLVKQLLLTVISFLLSLLILTFYTSFLQVYPIQGAITVSLNIFNTNTAITPLSLNFTALINALVITLFILGILSVLLVLRRLVAIFEDSVKARSLEKLEVTEEHFKELETCLTRLIDNMGDRLRFVVFDPIYPLPKAVDLHAELNRYNPWWSNLNEIIFAGVSRDLLDDIGYHISKATKKESEDFAKTLSEFIPKRIKAYCSLFKVLNRKCEVKLINLVLATLINDEYKINYNLDLIKPDTNLMKKYKKSVKQLRKLKAVQTYLSTEKEFAKLISTIESFRKLLD